MSATVTKRSKLKPIRHPGMPDQEQVRLRAIRLHDAIEAMHEHLSRALRDYDRAEPDRYRDQHELSLSAESGLCVQKALKLLVRGRVTLSHLIRRASR